MKSNDGKDVSLTIGQRLRDSKGTVGVIEKIAQEFVFVRFPDGQHRIRKFSIGKEFFIMTESVSQPQQVTRSAPVTSQKSQAFSVSLQLKEQKNTAAPVKIDEDGLNKNGFDRKVPNQDDHSKSANGKAQIGQTLSQKNQDLSVGELSVSDISKSTDGSIDVGTVLYSKRGVTLTVFEIYDKNQDPWFIALTPAINGAREALKYYFSQVGRDIFLEKTDSNLSTTELRKKSSYSLYFQAWDNSSRKIRFSAQPIPIDSEFEQSHFEKIEALLRHAFQDLLTKYGGENKDEYYAEYFGGRGGTTYLAERKHIERQIKEPYFGRVDCKNENGIYIGATQIDGHVIEWTDERAALYYEYQQYVADTSKGLSLVRSYQIQDGIYEGYTDLYAKVLSGNQAETIASQNSTVIADPHLMKILEMGRELKQVHDIIRTIQSNQYQIIASSPWNNSLILGCAGSGKTMILYHRIRYILRNNRNIRPEQVCILSPTEVLIHESDFLAETLHLDKVKKFSTATLYTNLIQQYSERYSVDFPKSITAFSESIKLNDMTIDIYSNHFLSILANNISELYSNGSLIHKGFIKWQDEKLKQKNDELLKQIELYVPFDNGDVNSTIEYLKDRGFSTSFVRSCDDTTSLLYTVSREAAQEELQYGIDKQIQETRNELFKAEDRLRNYQKDIDTKEKLERDKSIEKEAWEQERINFRETRTPGPLAIKANERRTINKIQNDNNYGDKIKEIEKKLEKAKNDLKGLRQKLQNEENRFKVLSEQVEQLQSSALQRKTALQELLSQHRFVGKEQHGNFSQLYKFYDQFEKVFPDRCTWNTGEKIDNPIEYIAGFGKIYTEMSQNCNIQKHSGSPSFYEAFSYAVYKAAESAFISFTPDFTVTPFLLLYGLNFRYKALETSEQLFFIDEFQDYNGEELDLLSRIYPNAIFNYYGDFSQCINQKGISSIQQLPPCMKDIQRYQISENYRNALEITEYANRAFGMSMLPIGLHGDVRQIATTNLSKEITFPQNGDRVAIIYKEMDTLRREGITLKNAKYHFLVEPDIEIVTEQINVLPISLAKGLEFERVYAITDGMDENEKYVAVTRALNELVLVSSDL